MPRKPHFESEQTRQWAIAAVMIVLLVCSLGLAFLATRHPAAGAGSVTQAGRRQTIGTLAISLPETWGRLGTALKTRGMDSGQLFGPPSSGPRLLVGKLRFGVPRSPLEALGISAGSLLPPAGASLHRTHEAVRSAIKTLVGRMMISIDGAPENATEHFLAVLTENGRDYWVVHLQTPPAPAEGEDSAAEYFGLFQSIIATTEDLAYRDATAADFAREDLPDKDPTLAGIDDLAPRVPVTQRMDDPISLVPVDDAFDGLRYFRVRAVPDAGVETAADPLSPDSLLALQFRRTMNRPPAAGEVARQEINGQPAWCATFALAPMARGVSADLIRQLWYTRSSPGRALLIEIVTEPGGFQNCQALLPRIVDALAPSADGRPTTRPSPSFEAPATRGVALAEAIRQAAGKLAEPDASFYRIDMDGRPIGYRIDQRLARIVGDPLPIAGNHSLVVYNELAMATRWQMSEDARRFRWRQELQTREGPADARANLIQQELTLDGGALVMRDVEIGGKNVWTAKLPNSYLGPMLDDLWVAAAAPADTAIVWMTPDGDPPIPFVVKSSPPAAGGDVVVSRRALTAMDADEAAFDSSGRLRRSDIYVRGTPAGEAVRNIRRVERSELIAVFPQLKDELDHAGSAAPKE